MKRSHRRGFAQAFGPGLLLAGNAIGVSHLVQSTRAGATYGLALIGVILLANIVKYPAFAFGPWHASATGTSLLEGYRRQGKWALVAYGLTSSLTILAGEAAISMVTAGLAIAVLDLDLGPIPVAAGVLVACAGVVAVGFRLVDRVMKLVMAILAVGTVVASVLVIPEIEWSVSNLVPAASIWADEATIVFVVALVGWMPTPIDISVLHSMWTIARRRDSGHRPSLRESMWDFNLGYVGAAVIALCFVMLGAGIMYASGAQFQDSSAGFAAQLIALYEDSLGRAAGVLLGVCAMLTMFTTTLSVVDGSARAFSTLYRRFSEPEDAGDDREARALRTPYWIALAFFAVGALVVLQFFADTLLQLVTLAMTVSFVTAPVLAFLNHRAVGGSHVPPELRPGRGMMAFSLVGVLIFAFFSLFYLYRLL